MFCFVFSKKYLKKWNFKKMEHKKKRYVVPAALEFCSHFHESVWHWAGKASADDWHITK